MILPKIVYLDTAKESLFKTKIEKAWIFALFCRLVAVYLIGKLSCWQNDCNIMRIMYSPPFSAAFFIGSGAYFPSGGGAPCRWK